ncbi:MAG: hypothetical protein CMO01_25520 [Thalassobius sp.]|nr:hypothetical protein [Thalassovita sp.]
MPKILFNNRLIKVAVFVLLCFSYVKSTAQDITALGGVLTTEYENDNESENSPKVIDGNINTKFLLFNFTSLWMQFQLNEPAVVDLYTLTSANDAADRDPKNWEFLASNDGENWVSLDEQKSQAFSERFQTKSYTIENTTAYEYYRINITANNGGSLFQLAEWRLYKGLPPEKAPSDLEGIATSGTEIVLSWVDEIGNETSFELEKSENGVDYSLLETLPANKTYFIDNDVALSSEYHYRIKAINDFGISEYSNDLSISTLDYTGAFNDLTNDGGSISVQYENDANPAEISEMLIDNDYNSKYLLNQGLTPAAYWIKYDKGSDVEEIVTKYTITSANDAPSRDPKNWTFEGSNNGTDWTVLDTRVNASFANRYETKTFAIENTAVYSIYRLNVTDNNGSTGIAGQIGELEIWGIPKNAPAIPSNLAAEVLSQSEITLTWEDNSTTESGFEIERSLDNVTFDSVATVDADLTSFTDTELTPITTYYYRINSISEDGRSLYSNTASGTTTEDTSLPPAPSSLEAVASSESEIALTWVDESDDELNFLLERSVDGIDYVVIQTIDSNATSYLDTALIKATHYYYRMKAVNEFGASNDYSEVASDTTFGVNLEPSFATIEDQVICDPTSTYALDINTVSAGEGESNQIVTLRATTDNPDFFQLLTVSQPIDGVSTINYKSKDEATGTATITITATDNGGTLNEGTDTYVQSFVMNVSEIEITISSSDEMPIPRGDIIQLTATGGVSYEWQEGPGILSGETSDVLTIQPTQDYVYSVIATTADGCSVLSEIAVKMDGTYQLAPSNIMTPNGDGKNDTWVIWNINTYPGNMVTVYDLSGREVFSQMEYANDWDGTSNGSTLAAGVYYYTIELGRGIPEVNGTITIIK